ncbi:FAD-binding oxidoreductase [Roseateles sp. DAIF2]|uniref:NAD(P)/FAD-dependent oxidoreductase n=1 Tax=Roseateles sp. DAIF2 TaxID=2714952 RepID=UPI0018A26967|nr:FAD-binding oxidoreductase [Roseateles sp. DAIF2]QPF75363.1 FAD-binding oxidoreductase [Roseateles sp. DAIF2]
MRRSVLILGGGAIGSAVAAHLAALAPARFEITVLERDPGYALASSARSAASIRQQFSTPLNIALSQYGLQVLRELGPQAALVEQGYLYLAGSAAGAEQLARQRALQAGLGADIELLEPAALAARWPWLHTQDLTLGAWGRSGEGWFDGWGLLQHFRRRALAAGVRYLPAEAAALEREASGALAGVRGRDGALLQADLYVLACGAWSGALAATAGLAVPVQAKRRSVYAFHTPERAAGCPLVIDPSGLWFRPEGAHGQFICGGPPLDAADPADLPLDPEPELFEQRLWPALAARVPGFESLRQQRAWAGYYEMNGFDHNGLVGPLAACPNLLLACGFSGHGLQHAPGIGRGLAEWIACGAYQSLDLAPLTPDRIAAGRPYLELNVI